MGAVKPDVIIGYDDPRRWLDDGPRERRWEELFGRLRQDRGKLTEQANTLERRRLELVQLQDVVDGQHNATTGTTDRTLTLNGSRTVRGTRDWQAPEGETFAEWYGEVTFADPFPAPPVVSLTVQEHGDPPPDLLTAWQITAHHVTPSGFSFRVTCSPAQPRATVHWRAEGDA